MEATPDPYEASRGDGGVSTEILYYYFYSFTLLERHHTISVFYSWGLHGHFILLFLFFHFGGEAPYNLHLL
jgi:hypothetical protein